jgi:hypothetical protein
MGKTSRKQRDQKRYQEELDKIRSEHQAKKKELEAQRKSDVTSTRLSEEATSAATPRMSESKEMKVGGDISQSGKTKKEKKKLELPTVEWQPGGSPRTMTFPEKGMVGAYDFFASGGDRINTENDNTDTLIQSMGSLVSSHILRRSTA